MVCQNSPEQLLVAAVSLADLPFDAVSVHSVLKPLLGDTDQDLYRCVAFTTFDGLIYGSEGKGRDRLAAAVFKERLYQQIAYHALPFPESRSRCHRANLVSPGDNAGGRPS